jgi:hypothetical protein
VTYTLAPTAARATTGGAGSEKAAGDLHRAQMIGRKPLRAAKPTL